MTEFSLRDHVRRVLDETDLTSPDEITDKVIGMIPKSATQSVLWMLLRDWIHVELTRYRMKPPASEQGPAPKGNRSAKVRAIRDAAPGWLRDRVWIGDGHYTLVGECTLENLQFLEVDRRQSAARHIASADAFRRLATLVKKHRVARVGDLPAPVLTSFEWREAA